MGLVILGHGFTRTFVQSVLDRMFGLFLLLYAYGLLTMKSGSRPDFRLLAGLLVPVNMVLFWSLHSLTRLTGSFIVLSFRIPTGSIGNQRFISPFTSTQVAVVSRQSDRAKC